MVSRWWQFNNLTILQVATQKSHIHVWEKKLVAKCLIYSNINYGKLLVNYIIINIIINYMCVYVCLLNGVDVAIIIVITVGGMLMKKNEWVREKRKC
jgi:hypothetical protein